MRGLLILSVLFYASHLFGNQDLQLYSECQKVYKTQGQILDEMKINIKESKSISPYACVNLESIDQGTASLSGGKISGMKNTPNECDQKKKNEKEYEEIKIKSDAMQPEAQICLKFINDLKSDKKRCLKICRAEKSIISSKICTEKLCGEADLSGFKTDQSFQAPLLQKNTSPHISANGENEPMWNQSHLDFKLSRGSFLLGIAAGSETATGTIKFTGTKIGDVENKTSIANVNLKYGVTNQFTVGALMAYSIDTKSVTRIIGSPESSVKIWGESNPVFETRYHFKEGRSENIWSPTFRLAVSPKFTNGKYRSTEQLLRSGGTSLEVTLNTAKKFDDSILGFEISHLNRFERTDENSDIAETSISTGGHSTSLLTIWQHITDDNNTFGLGFKTRATSSSESTTSTPSTVRKNESSSITKNSFLVRGSIELAQSAVFDLGYDYQLPYDYSFKSGSSNFDVAGDSVSSITLGLSAKF